jgi:hypothetical protein
VKNLVLGLVVAGTVGLALAACSWGDGQAETAGTTGETSERGTAARTLSGHGLSIELPQGWDGRVIQPSPEHSVQLVAGNFDIPPEEQYLGSETSRAMEARSIYVWLALSPLHEHLQPQRWEEASLPIRVGRSDLTNIEGFASPIEAARWLIVDGQTALVVVGFGVERPGEALIAEANRVLASLSLGGPAQVACEAPGEWARTRTATWLQRAATLAGFSVTRCTGSAWIVSRRTSFYLWTSPAPPSAHPVVDQLAGEPVYGGDVRIAWRVQGLSVWLEPGPESGEPFPATGELAELVITTRNLPRRYRPLELITMPPAALARCRSSKRLRPACPTRIPRVSEGRTYPRYGNPVRSTFGIERGGEFPGKPELNRPPTMLHLEISAGPDEGLRFPWPTGDPAPSFQSVLRTERDAPLLLGEVTWGEKHGTLVLAPPYPTGGSQGNHLIFRWRQEGTTYLVGLHAWEPISETVLVLRTIIYSIPR